MRRTAASLSVLLLGLAGCNNEAPYPIATAAYYSPLPPLPPPDYGARPDAQPPRRAVIHRATARAPASLTDDQIRIRILQAAVTACVPGAPCVCPEVTPDMIAQYRRQHRL